MFFFSSRRRHTRCGRDWSSDVCSSDLVDRIVVAQATRGRGLARRLYDELIREALRTGHERIVCEVNLSPPNPESDAFHAALGFTEVGSACIHGGAKTVRYLELRLT